MEYILYYMYSTYTTLYYTYYYMAWLVFQSVKETELDVEIQMEYIHYYGLIYFSDQ